MNKPSVGERENRNGVFYVSRVPSPSLPSELENVCVWTVNFVNVREKLLRIILFGFFAHNASW